MKHPFQSIFSLLLFAISGNYYSQCSLTLTANTTFICAGDSLLINASGASSYTWSASGQTTSAIYVKPLVSTVFSVSGQSGTCTANGSIGITVFTNPNVFLIASSTTICSGFSSTVNAYGAVSFFWQPGNLTGATTILSPSVTTVYTITGSFNGCIDTETLSIGVAPSPSLLVSQSNTAICVGRSATFSVSGASNYVWSPSASTNSNITVSPAVSSIYTVSGSIGACSAEQTLSLIVYQLPTLTLSASNPTLCGNRSSTITVSGANTYTWLPSNTSGSMNLVIPQNSGYIDLIINYSVIASSAQGCTVMGVQSITVSPPAEPMYTGISPQTICSGQTAYWNTAGASSTATFTYLTNPPTYVQYYFQSVPITETVTAPTVFTYSVISAVGVCTAVGTATLLVNPLPTVSLAASSFSTCSNSTVNVSASGASTYTWTGPTFTANANSLTLGTNPYFFSQAVNVYSVIGTSSAGCTNTVAATTTITVPNEPFRNLTTITPTFICGGQSITLSATGGVSYTWTPGNIITTSNSVVITPSASTNYSVVTTSSSGCVYPIGGDVPVNVSVIPTNLQIVANTTTVCPGQIVTLSVTGAQNLPLFWAPGFWPFPNYNVNPSINTIYTVTAGQGPCARSATYALIVVQPTLSVNSLSTICRGSAATMTVGGATTYSWLPGGLNGASVSLSPTTTTNYTVLGTSTLSGCTASIVSTVSVNITPTLFATVDNPYPCAGQTINLSAYLSGSYSNLTYSWSTGVGTSTNITSSDTPTVSQVYTITAFNGPCAGTATTSILVVLNQGVIANVSNPTLCIGGSSTLTGVFATTYTWFPGGIVAQSIVVSPSVSTTYSLIGDVWMGCYSSYTVPTIQVYPNPSLQIVSTPSFICSGTTGSLVIGGADSYSWAQSNFQTASISISPTVSTIYTCTGTYSASGCSSSIQTSIAVIAPPTISVSSNTTSLCAGSIASLSATGGTSFVWSSLSSSAPIVTVSPISTTIYTVTTFNGPCGDSKTVSINVYANPVLTISASTYSICSGTTSTLNAFGAQQYIWYPGSLAGQSQTVSPLVTSIYTVTGISSQGCVSSLAAPAVSVFARPSLSLSSISSSVCQGDQSIISVSGANNYTWSPFTSTTGTLSAAPLVSTTYTVIGTSSITGCSDTKTANIIVVSRPTIAIAASNSSICPGNSASLTASGATSYTWAPINSSATLVTISPTVNTNYFVLGLDAATGCTASAAQLVTIYTTPTIAIAASSSSICSGLTTLLTVSGASNYTWTSSNSTATVIAVSPPSSTNYQVIGLDAATGCTSNATQSITVYPSPTLAVSASTNAICSGSSSALTASGANIYSWLPGNLSGSNHTVTPLATTVFSVIGIIGNCLSSETIALSVYANPTLNLTALSNSLCSGKSTILTAIGANSYTWSPIVSNGNTVNVAPTASQNYTVKGKSIFGCISTSTLQLTVYNKPQLVTTSSRTLVCLGEDLRLFVKGSSTYSWSNNQNNDTIQVNANGVPFANFYAIGTDSMGCVSDTSMISIQVEKCLSITGGIEETKIRICPNPSNGLFHLEIASELSGSEVRVYNDIGQIIHVQNLTEEKCTIDLQKFANGIYHLVLVNEQNQNHIKLVKQ